MILKYLIKLYRKFFNDNIYARLRTIELSGQLQMGSNSRLYKETHIVNMQKTQSKIRIGEHSHIRGTLMIFAHGGEITLGDYCYVGNNSQIWSAASIHMGNRVLIAHNVNIHDNNSHPMDIEKRHLHAIDLYSGVLTKEGLDLNEKPIVIEDDVWIGFNCTILKGVTIKKGAIIGACSLVNFDVPEYAIVTGNPGVIKGYTKGKNPVE